MSENPPDDERSNISEEIFFWRGFIQWWARENDGPVPRRAWEALAYAEAKHDANDTKLISAKDS